MDPLLEDSLRRPRFSRARRPPSRVEVWAKSPIVAYRMGLTGTYALTIYFGISGLIAGIPAFDLTAPDGYVSVWAALVIVGAIVATIGSIHSEAPLNPDGPTSLQKVFRNIELTGAWLLAITIGSYAAVLLVLAYSGGDADLAAAGAGFIVLGSTPFWRMVWLMAQLGRR